MILLCGIPSEAPLAMVRQALAELGAPTIVFNQRRFGAADLAFEVAAGRVSGRLTLEDGTYDLSDIRGVYTRMMDDQALPEFRDLAPHRRERQACRDLHAGLLQWLEITPARVLNRCRPMASNASKPFQVQLIARQGFGIPETIITNDPEQVREFHARHGRVIYKSISGVRSIVQELQPADFARLEQVRWCPTQFQALVDGVDVRVHVVGGEVFATEIRSAVTDYRYAGRQGGEAELRAVTLDDEVSERCVRLAAALELPFAGIDLKVTNADEVFCFEVNPSPGFSYFESSTGQPIARAVARYLLQLA